VYAIVDIETTGGFSDSNGITEIAIYIHDGTKITEEFSSLIKPDMPIPPFLESYTGITNQMVSKAPSFHKVAPKVYEMLKDNIFIAHNVNFDYSFIHHQLKESGFALNTKKLCTVRLSRKVFPGYKSYSLGNICAARGISISGRHRAAGDAIATVKLFEQILANDDGDIISGFIKKGSKEYLLPPNLPKEQFDQLPQSTGVYYFHDHDGTIVYVGKAIDIKKRVASHFSGNKTNKQKQDFLRAIHTISTAQCATELMAMILESIEIKKHWPAYNRSLKKLDFNFAIYDYEDRNNYIRLAIDRVRKNTKPLQIFKTQLEAIQTLQSLVGSFDLCPKLCSLIQAKDSCAIFEGSNCEGACAQKEPSDSYNAKVSSAIEWLTTRDSYAILDKGLYADEASCILIENGKFYGMGYLPIDQQMPNIEFIKSLITPYRGSFYINELVQSEQLLTSAKIVRFETVSA
jgi:DNA polymerase III subunit epsilon